MVMDTLGLHVFGLPTCSATSGIEPGEIAAMLFSTAVYLFRSGDVIADGNTISGPGDERLVCFQERALLAPGRRVIDVDLGDPRGGAAEHERGIAAGAPRRSTKTAGSSAIGALTAY